MWEAGDADDGGNHRWGATSREGSQPSVASPGWPGSRSDPALSPISAHRGGGGILREVGASPLPVQPTPASPPSLPKAPLTHGRMMESELTAHDLRWPSPQTPAGAVRGRRRRRVVTEVDMSQGHAPHDDFGRLSPGRSSGSDGTAVAVSGLGAAEPKTEAVADAVPGLLNAPPTPASGRDGAGVRMYALDAGTAEGSSLSGRDELAQLHAEALLLERRSLALLDRLRSAQDTGADEALTHAVLRATAAQRAAEDAGRAAGQALEEAGSSGSQSRSLPLHPQGSPPSMFGASSGTAAPQRVTNSALRPRTHAATRPGDGPPATPHAGSGGLGSPARAEASPRDIAVSTLVSRVESLAAAVAERDAELHRLRTEAAAAAWLRLPAAPTDTPWRRQTIEDRTRASGGDGDAWWEEHPSARALGDKGRVPAQADGSMSDGEDPDAITLGAILSAAGAAPPGLLHLGPGSAAGLSAGVAAKSPPDRSVRFAVADRAGPMMASPAASAPRRREDEVLSPDDWGMLRAAAARPGSGRSRPPVVRISLSTPRRPANGRGRRPTLS